VYNIFKKFFKKKDVLPSSAPKTVSVINSTTFAGKSSGPMLSATYTNTIPIRPASLQNSTYAVNTASILPGTVSYSTPRTNSVALYKINGSAEIVRLDQDGTVTWGNGIDINAAAEAFGRSLKLGAEMKVGITQNVKYKMRDSVFADIIEIAKQKGPLTADDLTYLLEASKIVERLRGDK